MKEICKNEERKTTCITFTIEIESVARFKSERSNNNMRFLEIILVVVNFGLLYWVFIRRKKASTNIVSLWPLAVGYFMVIVQMVAEGVSWRMIPAYLTPVLLTAYLYVKRKNIKPRKWYVLTIQTVLLTVYLAITIIPPIVMPVFSFEKPTGIHSVGTVSYHWTDEKRKETFGIDPEAKRELMVQVWYPANEESEKRTNQYMRDVPEKEEGMAQLMGLPDFMMSHLGLVRVHSFSEGILSDRQERYPVLIFSHGNAGNRNQNTFQVEELASRGYIVVGIDHTYNAGATVFPDGRTVKYSTEDEPNTLAEFDERMSIWSEDVTFVLDQLEELDKGGEDDQLKGRLDLEKIGMFGHSYGGATAYRMLLQDDRVKAAINMDGSLFGGPVPEKSVQKPLFLMYSASSLDVDRFEADLDEITPEEILKQTGRNREALEKDFYDLMSRYEKVVTSGALSLVIPNSNHTSFTDLNLYSPLMRAKGEDTKQIHLLVNEFTLAFFDQYLRGTDDNVLEQLGAKYPEVHFQSK